MLRVVVESAGEITAALFSCCTRVFRMRSIVYGYIGALEFSLNGKHAQSYVSVMHSADKVTNDPMKIPRRKLFCKS